MKTIARSFALFLFCPILAHAQTTVDLTISVLDRFNQMPVDQALVELYDSGQLLVSGMTNSEGVAIFPIATGTSGEVPTEHEYSLGVAYPNPFSGKTSVPITIANPGLSRLSVYDILGRKVVSFQQHMAAGRYIADVDLSGLAKGYYLLSVANERSVLGTAKLIHMGSISGQPTLQLAPSLPRDSAPAAKVGFWGSAESTIALEARVSKEGYEQQIQPGIDVAETPNVLINIHKSGINTNSIDMQFLLIEAGTFDMGTSNFGFNEEPVHTVSFSHGFYMSIYETTQDNYVAIQGDNPSFNPGGGSLPVEGVSWFDAVRFANALSVKEGLDPCYDNDGNVIGGAGSDPYLCQGYRLPTEAEMEYAIRAGTTTDYFFGEDLSQLGNYAWYLSNSGGTSHAVGQKLPNPWGLYDMLGNVSEWVNDWYSASYYRSSPETDPVGPFGGSERVIRGASHRGNAGIWHSAFRHKREPDTSSPGGGFRLVKTGL